MSALLTHVRRFKYFFIKLSYNKYFSCNFNNSCHGKDVFRQGILKWRQDEKCNAFLLPTFLYLG